MRKRHTSGSRRTSQSAPSGTDSIGAYLRGASVSALFAVFLVWLLPSVSPAATANAATANVDRAAASQVGAEVGVEVGVDLDAPTPTGLPIVVAQADGSGNVKGSRPLEPRYQAIEPEPKSWYNGSYIFGMTRGLADSTIAPAAKGPLFLFTVPLDIAFLPFAVIGGMFG